MVQLRKRFVSRTMALITMAALMVFSLSVSAAEEPTIDDMIKATEQLYDQSVRELCVAEGSGSTSLRNRAYAITDKHVFILACEYEQYPTWWDNRHNARLWALKDRLVSFFNKSPDFKAVRERCDVLSEDGVAIRVSDGPVWVAVIVLPEGLREAGRGEVRRKLTNLKYGDPVLNVDINGLYECQSFEEVDDKELVLHLNARMQREKLFEANSKARDADDDYENGFSEFINASFAVRDDPENFEKGKKASELESLTVNLSMIRRFSEQDVVSAEERLQKANAAIYCNSLDPRLYQSKDYSYEGCLDL